MSSVNELQWFKGNQVISSLVTKKHVGDGIEENPKESEGIKSQYTCVVGIKMLK